MSVDGVRVVMGDQINQYGANAIGKITVKAPRAAEPHRRTILLLMANPLDTGQLRLDEEHRAIAQAIANSRYRDQIDLRAGAAVRYYDLQDLLLRHRPDVVHFAGHSGVNGIALVDEDGSTFLVSPAALTGLFSILGDSVRCVILNGCLTADQASAIAAHVPCVVGMAGSVLDDVAIEFAAGFHHGVANGATLATAFGIGRNRLVMRDMNAQDLVLKAKPGVAERITITG